MLLHLLPGLLLPDSIVIVVVVVAVSITSVSFGMLLLILHGLMYLLELKCLRHVVCKLQLLVRLDCCLKMMCHHQQYLMMVVDGVDYGV